RIQLAYPAHGEREAILSAASQELDLAREHISYLAGRISRDMRQLKSAIRRLTHAREMKGERKSPWTSTQLDQVCADLYTRRPEVAPERVLEVVAEYFQLTPEALRGPIRDKQHSMARHLAAYLCTENLQMNLKETAALIGRREHGSVIHARKKIEESLERDLFLRKQLQELTEKIFAG
ncbi:MAG: helix-turn-helix domain-containing protein, partial [Leptospirales bacterium]